MQRDSDKDRAIEQLYLRGCGIFMSLLELKEVGLLIGLAYYSWLAVPLSESLGNIAPPRSSRFPQSPSYPLRLIKSPSRLTCERNTFQNQS